MQAFYAEQFDREISCTEQEWLGRMPQAMGGNRYQVVARALTARIGAGLVVLSWRVLLPPEHAGFGRGQKLLASFRFSGLDDAQRYSFMNNFDQHMLRAR